jgi:hypothetical protein
VVTFILLLATGCINTGAARYTAKSTNIDGLLLSSAVTVVPAGQSRSQLWSESVASAAYDLSAPVSVQIACNGTTSGEWATRAARYQLRVTPDPELHFRKLFLDEIYRYWRDQPRSYLESYQYLPADKSVLEKNARYVLYIKPGHERPGATYLFYANNHVFELEFKSVAGDGSGPLSSFIAEHVAFREDGETIDQIYFEPQYSPLKLMALIESGALR